MAVMAAFTISAAGESIVNEIETIGGSGSSGSGKSGVVSSAGMSAISVIETVIGSAIDSASSQTAESGLENRMS
jgi:hypothetical protein